VKTRNLRRFLFFFSAVFFLAVSACRPRQSGQKSVNAEKNAEEQRVIPVETDAVSMLYAPVTYLPEEEEKKKPDNKS